MTRAGRSPLLRLCAATAMLLLEVSTVSADELSATLFETGGPTLLTLCLLPFTEIRDGQRRSPGGE